LEQLRQQLQKLQANIDQLDKQIEQLEGASHGDSKNLGVLTSDPSRYSMEPVPDQIKALEAKKSSLQAAMDQLLDAARASGIEPGQLR
jgi:prefoldin subunit 5